MGTVHDDHPARRPAAAPTHAQPSHAQPSHAAERLASAPDSAAHLLDLQRTAGNAAVTRAVAQRRAAGETPVQREPADAGAAPASTGTPLQQVMEALNRPDPVAGLGDYPAAWRVLNGLSMSDLLRTLSTLSAQGRLADLAARQDAMQGVDSPRLRAAVHTAQLASGQITAELLVNAAEEIRHLPADQRDQAVRHLAGHTADGGRTMEGVTAIIGSASLDTVLPPAALAAAAGPVGPGPWSPPGRQPIPFYIGNEAHEGIAAEYRAQHPGHVIFTNSIPMSTILASLGINPTKAGLGRDVDLRPDIANVSPARHLYEIKPAGSEALAAAEAGMYVGLFATAGYPMSLGPTGEPGTAGVVPAPAGHYVFSCPVPGAITYRYRRGRFVPVPVPAPDTEDSDIRLRLPPLSQQQQAIVVQSTAMTVLLVIMVILLIPVGA